MVRRMSVGFGLVLMAVVITACSQPVEPVEEAAPVEEMQELNIMLSPTEGNTAEGTLSIVAMGNGVHFTGAISGLAEGEHGFHVHETGDCSAPDGTSAGGHFNPEGVDHGLPGGEGKHLGDLGSIEANAEGLAEVSKHAGGFSMEAGENSIAGLAVIVHADPDDGGQPTGNAGARLACGVVPGGTTEPVEEEAPAEEM
jgi:Cu-Zn family superoxide dismutase